MTRSSRLHLLRSTQRRQAKNAATQAEEEIAPRQDAPLAALVFKTTADPYVGKLTYFRVYGGLFSSDSRVFNTAKGQEERIGQIYVMRGVKSLPPSPATLARCLPSAARAILVIKAARSRLRRLYNC
jgi:translation elongation factor EF-G